VVSKLPPFQMREGGGYWFHEGDERETQRA